MTQWCLTADCVTKYPDPNVTAKQKKTKFFLVFHSICIIFARRITINQISYETEK